MLKNIQLGRVDLNLLPVFEAVLAEGNVARAAARLHVTPSAVSHGLNRLRHQFNDPLFLKAPKGVVPTARALELADAIADVLARARRVVGAAEPFDPGRSKRRFTIGAPDAIAAVMMPQLLKVVQRDAPFIDMALRYVLRDMAFAELDARAIDVAVVPIDEVPARFTSKVVFEDEFQIVARQGHPFADEPTLKRYCEMQHVIVSPAGDARAYVDDVLASKGLSRRVAMTVPSFMLMLAVIAETDLIAALPKGLLDAHGVRFGLVGIDPPLPMRSFQLRAIAPKVAMMDAGVEWLFGLLDHPPSRAPA
ncbi:LysR family transcriptional regulator [Bradyrhizobium sp. AUGA SZCCT0283]|jgi:DNA-binding transcriptional LysR family regulator|uniref:LysR family transcriptional regulator n=1 Tax=Bradyrhizobium sp. AUGA SZCCT0283 TaxID=2807671 RepID=UPI001BA89A63|nr:LysR family transcriptional regulator [Bradyrhizobium sp. AUGA SZCCT0283]MBR1277414.1 LysR family transcriptional regulator [Bradyrhizobium sp. AUGA SZCCT0283]